MRLLTSLLVSCSLAVLITGVIIHKECEPRNEFDIKWQGSKVYVTFWLLEKSPNSVTSLAGGGAAYNDHELIFNINFIGHSSRDNRDQISLTLNRATLRKIRNRVHANITFDFPDKFKEGWNTLTFFSTPHSIKATHRGTIILDYDPGKELNIDKVLISGPRMVINCHHSSLLWHAKRKVNVPLPPLESNHNLSLFSNIPTKPVFRLDSSNDIQLGWDGKGLADYTKYKEEEQISVPPSEEHWLTISCRSTENVTCIFKDGKQETDIVTLKLKNLPKELTIWTQESNDLLVFYHQPKSDDGHKNVSSFQSMDSKKSPEEGHNPWMPVAIVLIILIVAVTSLVFTGYWILRQRGMNILLVEEGHDTHELVPLVTTEKDEILQAIEKDDYHIIEEYIMEAPVKEEYMVQAHYWGSKRILKHFRLVEDLPVSQPNNEIIRKVREKLDIGIRKIFEEADKGRYYVTLGLLEKHKLPKSVTDHQGYSILHHLVKFKDSKPVWQQKDIQDFLERQGYFINAIDYRGNTVLHHLAMSSVENCKVQWDNREMQIEEVMVIMAKMLIEEGADPNQNNFEGKKPHTLANESGRLDLENLLRSSDQIQTDLNGNRNKFKDLVKAARKGDVIEICQLLKEGVPILPVYAENDPLIKAARENQREAFFLLLSAGAPICSRSIESQTLLDVTHNTQGLPAFYAAVVRKAFCDRLTIEREKAMKIKYEKDDTISKLSLADIIDGYIHSIESEGKEVKNIMIKHHKNSDRESYKNSDWESYSAEVRKLLSKAALKGLSLTCLLLGQRDVYLHPLPGESSLFSEDIWKKHYEMQLVLCRDLSVMRLVPIKEDTKPLHLELLKDMYYGESRILSQKLETDKKTYDIDRDMINSLKEYDGDLRGNVTEDLLRLIAKFNLVVHLDKIVNKTNQLDVNQIVEKFSGSTMLHIAAMYGQIKVVEYLIYKLARLDMLIIGGFSAAHLAAIRGHKECFLYIQAWMRCRNLDMVDKKCNIDLTGKELMDKYEELCENCDYPLLPHRDALVVQNAKKVNVKTYEIICRKGKLLGINNFCELKKYVENRTYKYPNEKEEAISLVRKSTGKVMEKINKHIGGKYYNAGPLEEGNELLDINYLDFTFEADSNLDEYSAIELITKKFLKCIKDAVHEYKDEENEISLSPPFVKYVTKGFYIHWVCYKQGKLKLLTSYIVPLVRITNRENAWFCYDKAVRDLVSFSYEDDIKPFKSLTENDKLAWLICRMLRKLTRGYWWSPSFNDQFYEKDWHTWTLGVKGISDNKNKKLFRKEIGKHEDVYETVFSSFKSIVEKQMNGKWVPKKTHLYSNDEKLYMCGVLWYLEFLKNETYKQCIQQNTDEI